MAVEFLYKIKNSQYRRKLRICQFSVFVACIICFISMVTLLILQGVKSRYENLEQYEMCDITCKTVTKFGWFPVHTVVPLSAFQSINLEKFKLNRQNGTSYYLCNNISFQNTTIEIDFKLTEEIQDISNMLVRFPKNNFGNEQKALELKFNDTVIIMSLNIKGEIETYLVDEQNKSIIWQVSEEFGSQVIILSANQLVQTKVKLYQVQQCQRLNNDIITKQQQVNSKYLVAVTDEYYGNTYTQLILQPLYIQFVSELSYYNWIDYLFISFSILSGIGLLEVFLYAVFECTMKLKIKKQHNEWMTLIDDMNVQAHCTGDNIPIHN